MARIDFTFEKIVFLTDRDLLTLLTEVDNVTLLQACQRVDDHILIRIRSVLSETACGYFNDDLSKFWMTSNEESLKARYRIARVIHMLYRRGRFKDWIPLYAA